MKQSTIALGLCGVVVAAAGSALNIYPPVATAAVLVGGIGAVASVGLAYLEHFAPVTPAAQHVLRIEAGDDKERELRLYAQHNGYRYKFINGQAYVRRDSASQPELVVFEVAESAPKTTSTAKSFVGSTHAEPAPAQSGFVY